MKRFRNLEEKLENTIEIVTYIKTELEVDEIQKNIDALPHGYKTVFVLYAVEGYKHSEISESTSKTQLFKASKMLRASIEKQNNKNYGTH